MGYNDNINFCNWLEKVKHVTYTMGTSALYTLTFEPVLDIAN